MSTDKTIDISTTRADSTTVERANASKRKRRASSVSTDGTIPRVPTGKTITRKKARNAKGKQSTGKLAILVNMPLDIWLEIFERLMPIDLLNLSRVSKPFRNTLMHRSSMFIWRVSFANVPDLPSCPPGMAEPRWADLVFGKHCMACLGPTSKRGESIKWHLRIRLCADCLNVHIAPVPKGDDEIYRSMVPAFQATNAKSTAETCHVPVEDYNTVKGTYLLLNGEARETFVVESKARVQSIAEHAKLCITWAKSQASARARELQKIKEVRKYAIIEKLTALGYGSDIWADWNFSKHKLVRQPKPLTERVWSNIKDQMIEYLSDLKRQRLQRKADARRWALDIRRCRVLSFLEDNKAKGIDIMPEPIDFCEHPPIKSLIDAGLYRDDFADIDNTDFGPIIATFFQEWRARINRTMVHILLEVERTTAPAPVSEYDAIVAAERTLQLATTVFRCVRCTSDLDIPCGRRPLSYPKVLAHGCLTGKIPDKWCSEQDHAPKTFWTDDSRDLVHYKSQRTAWTAKSLCLDREAGVMVEAIVRAVGLDPNVTTAVEMDQLDARLGCLSCGRIINNITVVQSFGWRSAVQHHAEMHRSDYDDDILWRCLSDRERADALSYEQFHLDSLVHQDRQRYLQSVPSDRVVWVCKQCADTTEERPPMELSEVLEHIKTRHAKKSPVVDVHYFKDLAAPQLYLNDNPFEVGRNIVLDQVAIPAPLFSTSYINSDSGQGYCTDSGGLTYASSS